MGEELSKETIFAALSRLNEELERNGIRGELCLFGGAVMVLTFHARPMTKDVDAIFQPAPDIRHAAIVVQQEMKLPQDWLNDGVKGWVSARGEVTEEGLPQFSNLHLTRPTATYLLAMKALAARSEDPDHKGDRNDIITLLRHLDLPDAESVLNVVERFYPSRQILPKTEYLIRDIFHELQTAKPEGSR